MGGFGENAQATSAKADHDLQTGDGDCREDGVSGDRTFFRAHRFRSEDRRRSGHVGIIAAWLLSCQPKGRMVLFGEQPVVC